MRIFVFVVVMTITGTLVIALPANAAFVLWISRRRTWVTVALTDRSVVVIENGRRRMPPDNATITRLPLNSICLSEKRGDASVAVGGEYFWVNGSQQDEARRLSLLSTHN